MSLQREPLLLTCRSPGKVTALCAVDIVFQTDIHLVSFTYISLNPCLDEDAWFNHSSLKKAETYERLKGHIFLLCLKVMHGVLHRSGERHCSRDSLKAHNYLSDRKLNYR